MPSNLAFFQKLKEAELKTAELYRKMADKVENTATKKRLREMEEDELLHALMVENSKELWLKAVIPEQKLQEMLQKADLFLEEVNKKLVEVEEKDSLNPEECKEIALKIEFNMGEIHLNSLKQLRHSDLKEIVKKLSSFDRTHLERIKEWD